MGGDHRRRAVRRGLRHLRAVDGEDVHRAQPDGCGARDRGLKRVVSFLQQARDVLDSGRGWAGLGGDSLAFVLAQLAEQSGRWLVVVDEPDAAERLLDGLRFFLREPGRALLLPADDCRPYDGFSPSASVLRERLLTLHHLDQGKDGILVAPVRALLQRLPDASTRRRGTRALSPGDELDRDDLTRFLQEAGYLATGRVEEPGTFAVRGDVVDVWPTGLRTAARLDFFDDEIEHIRRMDPETQRSGRPLKRLVLLPVREERLDRRSLALLEGNLGRLVATQGRGLKLRRRVVEELRDGIRFSAIEDWLPALVPTVEPLELVRELRPIIVHPEDVKASARDLISGLRGRWEALEEDERPLVPPEERYAPLDPVLELIERGHAVFDVTSSEAAVELGARPADGLIVRGADMDAMVGKLVDIAGHGVRLGLVAGKERLQRVEEMLGTRGVEPAWVAHPLDLNPSQIGLVEGRLARGFVAEDSGWAFVPTSVLFGERTSRRREAHAAFKASVSSLSQLREGDFVVHRFHGIGLYKGMARLDIGAAGRVDLGGEVIGTDENSASVQDYVLLEYRDGDRMYLPVTHIDQLSRHAPARSGAKVRLDKLGGVTWAARKGKVRDSVLKMAQELLSIYARRELATREAYPPPGEWSQRFEAEFPYEETLDQAAAIDAIHADLSKKEPMDRLLCGDVGFGKTEVAMRAAMRVLEAGKQIMVLCPTTVLAFQHFRTFQERFAPYGAEVRMLSRFVGTSDQTKIKNALKDHTVDIVVGTTGLLARGVKFDDLGLVIIDEEHRFGVRQKDRLKKMRAAVDVLAMSATPIPRTLEMGLIGMRNMSIMSTPPNQRLEVRTSVARMTRVRVRDALMQEHARGGQSFFVHNRIEGIDDIAAKLREWVPELRFAVAHGQMEDAELERILVEFIRGEHDVLISTAIIESGIDLPNVNTMLVNRADMFGLAQLYQLRGRVGRGDTRATCLLLVPEELTKEAKKRIRVLVDHTRLGSGFQIASADLELRGAGNLLGDAQSGNIDAVGYEMWLELLADAVREAKGEIERERIDPEVEVPLPAFLPQQMVPELHERLDLYRRFSAAPTADAIDHLLDELEHEHGELPVEVRNLAGLSQTKILCRELAIVRCTWLKVRAVFELHSATPIPEERLERLLRVHPKRFELREKDGVRQLSVRFLPSEAERPFRFLRWVLAQLARG
ncbi:MAG: transcription-repair coupling factor [Deltaproteobacteria bacterium]|nr:MAG: transcription-repair coupling factor [Deltaproteobacteria bacterium]